MTETQRQRVPRNDAGELDTAMAFLGFARESVLKKADGLDDEQLRRVLVGTGTTILGLVRHLAIGERYWFGYHLVGSDAEREWDFDMDVASDRASAQVLDDYRAAAAESDAAIRAAGGPDASSYGRWTASGSRFGGCWLT